MPGAPPVQADAVFKKAFEESRKSLKAKFAARDRLVVVSRSTLDVRGAEPDHGTEAVPEEEVEDYEFVHKCRIEAAFGRLEQHDQMLEQLCPVDADMENGVLEDATGGLPQFVASAEDADVDSSSAVATSLDPAHSNGSVSVADWWHEIVW